MKSLQSVWDQTWHRRAKRSRRGKTGLISPYIACLKAWDGILDIFNNLGIAIEFFFLFLNSTAFNVPKHSGIISPTFYFSQSSSKPKEPHLNNVQWLFGLFYSYKDHSQISQTPPIDSLFISRGYFIIDSANGGWKPSCSSVPPRLQAGSEGGDDRLAAHLLALNTETVDVGAAGDVPHGDVLVHAA